MKRSCLFRYVALFLTCASQHTIAFRPRAAPASRRRISLAPRQVASSDNSYSQSPVSSSQPEPTYRPGMEHNNDYYLQQQLDYQQQYQQEIPYFQRPRPSLDWRQARAHAQRTFREFRELEAAGLLNSSNNRMELEAAHDTATHAFAAFQECNDNTDNDSSGSPTKAHPKDQTTVHAMERALLRAAAALGQSTGKIFGGAQPENYRD